MGREEREREDEEMKACSDEVREKNHKIQSKQEF